MSSSTIFRSMARPVTSSSSARQTLHRSIQRRTLVAAPQPNSGPLMERRGDRALPDIPSRSRWLRTLPLFLLGMAGCALAIFNYQKSNSSIVSSTLYALRKHPEARKILGDEIYFAHQIPWIWGTINQLHGQIDISFSVKGTKGRGMMRFVSERKTRMGYFDTLEWSLQPDGSQDKISLLEDQIVDPLSQADITSTTAMIV